MRAKGLRGSLTLLAALALLSAAAWGADTDAGTEGSWVIAAKAFEAGNVSPSYAGYAEAIPLMVIQRLSRGFTRLTPISETESRELIAYREGLNALLKARADLVTSRDKILFDSESSLVRAKRRKAAEAKIDAKEKEITAYQEENAAGTSPAKGLAKGIQTEAIVQPVTLWESGLKLYAPKTGDLDSDFRKAGIQGLVSGNLEDAAGYLVVTLRLDTGLPGVDSVETVAAGAYEDLDRIVDSLVSSVTTVLFFKNPVTLKFSVTPPEATVFVDGGLLPPGIDEMVVPEGEHRIDATAEGYEPSNQSRDFSGFPGFMVTIDLRREAHNEIAFSSSVTGSLVYLETEYVGASPAMVSVPPRVSLGIASAGDVNTWFYLDATKPARAYSIESNAVNTKTRIDTQRSVLYWSLGALYASLPVTMITYGVFQDKLRAFNADYLPNEQGTYDDIIGWQRGYTASLGITVGLGVNYIVQLVRYLVAANQALPERALETGD